MTNKLIVLSMDAMVTEDLEYLKTKPNFRKLFAHAASVGKVRTVYPSLTYPAHTSIITGCKPGKHGIFDNNRVGIKEQHDEDWYIDAEWIRTDDVFKAAKRAGRSTAGVYWPVTVRHPQIDHLIGECFGKWMPGVEPEEMFRRLDTAPEMMEIIRNNMDRYPEPEKAGPELCKKNTSDEFLMGCACDVIRRYQPDLLMIHNCYPDSTRHRYGVFSEKMTECLDFTDQWLGDMIGAMEEAGICRQTNFVLLSDHGQMDYSRRIRLNTKFVRDGMITLAEDGSVADWKMFMKSAGMSAYIYVKDRSFYEEAYAYLQGLLSEGVWGFEKIRTKEETEAQYGLYGDYDFMVETDGYTSFADPWHEPIHNPIDFTNYRLGKATHGYEPEKGPQPVFVAAGPDFREDTYIPEARIWDEGPTFARLLGSELKDAEGEVLTELLN